ADGELCGPERRARDEATTGGRDRPRDHRRGGNRLGPPRPACLSSGSLKAGATGTKSRLFHRDHGAVSLSFASILADVSAFSLLRRPTAFLPVVLSIAALGVVGAAIISGAAVREPDEGTAAHIWQLLMAVQLPIVAYFVIAWGPRAPRAAALVLALLLGAA